MLNINHKGNLCLGLYQNYYLVIIIGYYFELLFGYFTINNKCNTIYIYISWMLHVWIIYLHLPQNGPTVGTYSMEHLGISNDINHIHWIYGGFPKMEVFKNGWFIRENAIKMDDFGERLF